MAAQSNRRASDQRVVLLVPHTGSMGNVATQNALFACFLPLVFLCASSLMIEPPA